jgi:hypothetical protein
MALGLCVNPNPTNILARFCKSPNPKNQFIWAVEFWGFQLPGQGFVKNSFPHVIPSAPLRTSLNELGSEAAEAE